MSQPVAFRHPKTGTQVTVDPTSTRARRMRAAGWTEIPPPPVEDPAASAATPPAWLSMPDPDLDLDTEDDLSEED